MRRSLLTSPSVVRRTLWRHYRTLAQRGLLYARATIPFTDPELRVYTSTLVKAGLPVLLVFHDDDGAWQFLSGTEQHPDEIVVAHVAHLVDEDATLHEVADLPLGWKTWRESLSDSWFREPTPEGQAEF